MESCLPRKEGWIRKRQVRSQNRCLCIQRGNEEYEELIAPYIREENVYFDLDSAKEALKKEK